MCITPNTLWVQRGSENWEQLAVPCRICWRCKRNRLNDYVARSMAEARTSIHVATVSLTYAPREDLADKLLTPKHFQMFIKQLRNAGHLVRYLVAGEYGDLKGRAHFHALLFFQHIAPLEGRPVPAYGTKDAPFCREIPQKRMCHIREWPHGHISVDWSASEQAARYVCKYLLADDKNNAWFSLSKKPALGAAWFAQKAALAVEHSVIPSSFNYLPPGGNKDRPYLMTGATRRDYLSAITQDPADLPRMSEWVALSFEKQSRARHVAAIDALSQDEKALAFEEALARKDEVRILEEKHRLQRLLDLSTDNTLKPYMGRLLPDTLIDALELKREKLRDQKQARRSSLDANS